MTFKFFGMIISITKIHEPQHILNNISTGEEVVIVLDSFYEKKCRKIIIKKFLNNNSNSSRIPAIKEFMNIYKAFTGYKPSLKTAKDFIDNLVEGRRI